MNKTNVVIIAILLFAVIFLGLSFFIPTLDQSIEIYKNRMGARFFPQLLLVGIIIISLIVLYIDNKKTGNQKSKKGSIFFPPEIRNRIISTFLSVLIFAVLFNWLGAFPSIFIFVFLYLYNYGIKKIYLLVVTPSCVVLGIYLVFYKLLSVRLPKGILNFLF